MLVRLLRMVPDWRDAAAVRAAIDRTLSPANLARERAYFGQANRQSFERTYGWAWLLKLAAELQWDDPDARRWSKSIEPLAATVAARYRSFFSEARLSHSDGRPPKHRIRPGLCVGLRRGCG